MTLADAYREATAAFGVVTLVIAALALASVSLVSSLRKSESRQRWSALLAGLALVGALLAACLAVGARRARADEIRAAWPTSGPLYLGEACRGDLALRRAYEEARSNAVLCLWLAPFALVGLAAASARLGRRAAPSAVLAASALGLYAYAWHLSSQSLPGPTLTERQCDVFGARDAILRGPKDVQRKSCNDLEIAFEPQQNGILPKAPELEALLPELRHLREVCADVWFAWIREGGSSGIDALDVAERPLIVDDQRDAFLRRVDDDDAQRPDERCGGREHRICFRSEPPARVVGTDAPSAIATRQSVRETFPLLASCDVEASAPFRFTLAGRLQTDGGLGAASIEDVSGLSAESRTKLLACAERALRAWTPRPVRSPFELRYRIEGRPTPTSSQ